MLCPSHPLFDHPSGYLMRSMYQRSSSLCRFLQPPAISSFPGPYMFLNILFFNTFSLCSTLSMRDQLSQPKQWAKLWFYIFKILRTVYVCFHMYYQDQLIHNTKSQCINFQF
jgi:hypothetical protein